MKKLSISLISLLFVFVLSACGLLEQEPTREDLANETIEHWEGDLTFLSQVVDNMALEEQMTMIHTLEIIVEEDGVTHGLNATETIRYIKTALGQITAHQVVVEIDEDTYDFQLIIEEANDTMDIYFNIATFMDELDDEDDVDLEIFMTLLDIDGDWLRFRYEDTIANIIELEVFEAYIDQSPYQGMLDMYLDMLGYEDLEALIAAADTMHQDIINQFRNYLNLDYIGSHEDIQLELEKTEADYLTSSILIDHSMMHAMLDTLLEELWTVASELSEMPIDPFHQDQDYQAFMATLENAEPIETIVTFDPLEQDTIWVVTNLKGFANDVIEMEDATRPINHFTLTSEIKNTATIALPDNYIDLNRVIDELAKYLLLISMYELTIPVMEATLTADIYSMNELNMIYQSPMYHLENTTFNVTSDGDVEVNYIYFDDKEALVQSIDFADYQAFIYEPDTRAAFLSLIDLIHPDHFSMTRMFLLFIDQVSTAGMHMW